MGFGNLELITLQQYWWIIISLLGGLFVFIMFVQGGQTLIDKLSENETEKTMLINSIGRKWELGFTTLVLFGGALFAAFPLFYSTSFGGAYWVWLAILFCFIIQAVSYEYRTKPNNFLGQKTYEYFLKINGNIGTFLLGVAISTFFSGSEFIIDSNNFVNWQNPLRGLEALLNPYNYLLGFSLVFLAKISGALYFINNIDYEKIREKAVNSIKINMLLFLFFFLGFMFWILTKDGFALKNGIVFIEKYKYLFNFIEMPIILGMFLIGVIMVIVAVFMTIIFKKTCCIKTGGVGIVLTVMSLLLNVGFNNTSYYPSTSDLQSSLTIMNSSGSHYTLMTMSYVSLMVPFVLAYIAFAWYSMDKVKITKDEIESKDSHNY
ncbi:cytochrome d ubiquinol oxidase subunit II [Aliarcobacter butzleri]|uniref:Cytochrome d ubiquinol oxidase subunit II n=1 Tax=Aliarcobacter butzleri TaxID=28197 RepID=A0AAW7QBW2_9BACT|nr:cytochrome d ubiquinol oxidase subunit II [Aliarcobacter butzleri]KLE10633.1 cytochrome C oxidase assembly protein [Aliarcobacter butzleri L354]MCG3714450.1 cytochrome d ubiquinol oxidase subunit II [Aliarcobacter butzleri]MCT7589340.1 cytochrome d ubiquinol oxidase subunit II [Aliarcobacter butzleri]MDN5106711.1 cytochrome d ubiquinol oxidase subunit II [Aliarcobacter butzleri]MDN5123433.1 cytochrome d ubiquinol oxidase subunit II [Aliarcobacter butzleri]